jgi:hypothetical protein
MLIELLRGAPCQYLKPSVDADDAHTLRKALRCDGFYSQADSAVLVRGKTGNNSWADCLLPLFAMHDLEGVSCVCLCLRSGFSLRGTRCALLLDTSHPSCLLFSVKGVKAASEALKGFIADAPPASISVELYRTPFQCTSTPRSDDFWGANWTDRTSATSTDYDVYRLALDSLVEEAIREHAGVGELEDGTTSPAQHHILEICAGDGALAEKLLRKFHGAVARYTLSERNAALVAAARQRLATFSTSPSPAGTAPLATVIHAAATQPEAYPSGDSGVAPTICVAAGSVLNGQVGSPAEAETVLMRLGSCLAPGGILIASGVSGSLLTPTLMRRAGFDEVLQGSVDSQVTCCDAAPAGIDHGLGRAQLFVLRRRSSPAPKSTAQGVYARRPGKGCLLFDALASSALD